MKVYKVNFSNRNLSHNWNKNPHNLERIIEKYKNLAKEALSSGDKILHENYLQHSDHFSRILSELGSNKVKETFNYLEELNYESFYFDGIDLIKVLSYEENIRKDFKNFIFKYEE